MIISPLEDNIRGKPIMMPLQRKEPRHRLRSRCSDVPGDEVEHEIVPCHRCARGDELLALTRNDQHAIRLQRNARKHLGESLSIAPVDRGRLTIEKASLRQQKDA